MHHRFALSLAAALLSAGVAAADPLVSKDDRVVLTRSEQAIDDAVFGLEQAIVGAGLVIDYNSHTGDMLARTGADVGSDVVLFDKAEIFLFCSASLSREMMEADLTYVGLCPYSVFAFSHPGEPDVSYLGYRKVSQPDTPEDSPLKKIDALLEGVIEEAASGF